MKGRRRKGPVLKERSGKVWSLVRDSEELLAWGRRGKALKQIMTKEGGRRGGGRVKSRVTMSPMYETPRSRPLASRLREEKVVQRVHGVKKDVGERHIPPQPEPSMVSTLHTQFSLSGPSWALDSDVPVTARESEEYESGDGDGDGDSVASSVSSTTSGGTDPGSSFPRSPPPPPPRSRSPSPAPPPPARSFPSHAPPPPPPRQSSGAKSFGVRLLAMSRGGDDEERSRPLISVPTAQTLMPSPSSTASSPPSHTISPTSTLQASSTLPPLKQRRPFRLTIPSAGGDESAPPPLASVVRSADGTSVERKRKSVHPGFRNPAIREYRKKLKKKEAAAEKAHAVATKKRRMSAAWREDGYDPSSIDTPRSDAGSESMGALKYATTAMRLASVQSKHGLGEEPTLLKEFTVSQELMRQKAVMDIARHARTRSKEVRKGQFDIFSTSERTQLYYGMEIALQSLDGGFVCVDRDSGQVCVQMPEEQWEARGLHPFRPHKSAAPPSAPVVPAPLWVFRILDLRNLFNRSVVRAGDPIWLAVVCGSGQTGWRDGSVLSVRIHRPVALQGDPADPLHAERMQFLLDLAPGVVRAAGKASRASAPLRKRLRDFVSLKKSDAGELMPRKGEKHEEEESTRVDLREIGKEAEEELRMAVEQAAKTGSALRLAQNAYRKINSTELIGSRMGIPLPVKAFVPASYSEARIQADYATATNIKAWYSPSDPDWARIVEDRNRMVRHVGMWKIKLAEKIDLGDGLVLGALGPEKKLAFNATTAVKAITSTHIREHRQSHGESDEKMSILSDSESDEDEKEDEEGEGKEVVGKRPTSTPLPSAASDPHRPIRNMDKIFLSQDYFYICSEARREATVGDDSKKSKRSKRPTSSQRPMSPATPSSPSMSPLAHSRLSSPASVRSRGDGLSPTGSTMSGSSSREAGSEKKGRDTILNPIAVDAIVRRRTAAPVALNELAMGIHSPYKVEPRGVFRIRIITSETSIGENVPTLGSRPGSSSSTTAPSSSPSKASRTASPSPERKGREENDGEEGEGIAKRRRKVVVKHPREGVEGVARAQLSRSQRSRTSGASQALPDERMEDPDQPKSGSELFPRELRMIRKKIEARLDDKYLSYEESKREHLVTALRDRASLVDIALATGKRKAISGSIPNLPHYGDEKVNEKSPMRMMPSRRSSIGSVGTVRTFHSRMSVPGATPLPRIIRRASQVTTAATKKLEEAEKVQPLTSFSDADAAEAKVRKSWRDYFWSPVRGREAPPLPGQPGYSSGVDVLLPPKPFWVELEDEAENVRERIEMEERKEMRQRETVFGRLQRSSDAQRRRRSSLISTPQSTQGAAPASVLTKLKSKAEEDGKKSEGPLGTVTAKKSYREAIQRSKGMEKVGKVPKISGPIFGERMIIDGKPLAKTGAGKATEDLMDRLFVSLAEDDPSLKSAAAPGPSMKPKTSSSSGGEEGSSGAKLVKDKIDRELASHIRATSRHRQRKSISAPAPGRVMDDPHETTITLGGLSVLSPPPTLDEEGSSFKSEDDDAMTTDSESAMDVGELKRSKLKDEEENQEAFRRLVLQAGLGFGVGGATAVVFERLEDDDVHRVEDDTGTGKRSDDVVAESSSRVRRLSVADPRREGSVYKRNFSAVLEREDARMAALCVVETDKQRTQHMFSVMLSQPVTYELPEDVDLNIVTDHVDPKGIRARFQRAAPTDERHLSKHIARGRTSSTAKE